MTQISEREFLDAVGKSAKSMFKEAVSMYWEYDASYDEKSIGKDCRLAWFKDDSKIRENRFDGKTFGYDDLKVGDEWYCLVVYKDKVSYSGQYL